MPHWRVTVTVDGEDVLTIESNYLSGKSDLSDTELDAIRTAANHLLGFVGAPDRDMPRCDISLLRNPYPYSDSVLIEPESDEDAAAILARLTPRPQSEQ